jgi:hypothetical protein
MKIKSEGFQIDLYKLLHVYKNSNFNETTKVSCINVFVLEIKNLVKILSDIVKHVLPRAFKGL